MNLFTKYLEKCVQHITADVSFEDESKQFFVMLRICQIVMFVYFICFEVLTLFFKKYHCLPLALLWIVLTSLGFLSTYRFRRQIVFHIFSIVSLIWILVSVVMFGWDAGVQHFLFPLLIVSFFASYSNFRGKAAYTFFLFAFRLSLFIYVKMREPLYPFPSDLIICYQILNMITLFSIMFFVCWTFSTTNQEAQEKLEFYNQRLKLEARTDSLTGLMNRRSMLEYLEAQLSSNSGGFTSVAIGDIDFFKNVNDTRGHNCGDEVLRQIGALFQSYMADKGYVCRWGGEEFFFVFSANGDTAYRYISDLRSLVKKMLITAPDTKEMFSITMTFGVEEYNFNSSVTELIKLADDKLYAGKENGRDRVIY